ncbi:MAG TPA: hypothetical protein PLQ56_19795 [Aggregatilineales bacterium]|nr:hypothetical protein [Aggregatilineales bacterium]
MRLLKVVLFMAALFVVVLPAMAQDSIELGQEIEGEVTNRDYEFEYTFSGSEGQLISIEMKPAGDSQLDPEVYLYDSENELLAVNDDFSYPSSLILINLPADGEYTVVAGRNDGRSGSSEGEFVLTVSEPEAMELGTDYEATYTTDYSESTVFLLAPTEDGPLTLTYVQDVTELYPRITVSTAPDWSEDPEFGFYSEVMSVSSGISEKGSISINVQAGMVYLVEVEMGGYSPETTYSEDEATVTISVG